MADDVARARSTLGVGPDADWATIRSAYRREIRRAHPDIVGGTTSQRSVDLNSAYRLLARHHRHTPPPPPSPSPPPPSPPPTPDRCEASVKRQGRPAADGAVVDNSTIVLTSTPAESFRRLVEAANTLGSVSYVDRSSAIFEAVLALEEGIHASLVVSLQWRAHDATCEAFCTLEALERAETLNVSGVLQQLLDALPPDRDL